MRCAITPLRDITPSQTSPDGPFLMLKNEPALTYIGRLDAIDAPMMVATYHR
jgi:hypothetical protein